MQFKDSGSGNYASTCSYLIRPLQSLQRNDQREWKRCNNKPFRPTAHTGDIYIHDTSSSRRSASHYVAHSWRQTCRHSTTINQSMIQSMIQSIN